MIVLITHELVKTIELRELVPLGKQDLQLTARLEIFQSSDGIYSSKLWLLENLRVLPTEMYLPSLSNLSLMESMQEDMWCDKIICYLEETLGFDQLTDGTVEGLLKKNLDLVSQYFAQVNTEGGKNGIAPRSLTEEED